MRISARIDSRFWSRGRESGHVIPDRRLPSCVESHGSRIMRKRTHYRVLQHSRAIPFSLDQWAVIHERTDSVRNDPRYTALLHKMNLPE